MRSWSPWNREAPSRLPKKKLSHFGQSLLLANQSKKGIVSPSGSGKDQSRCPKDTIGKPYRFSTVFRFNHSQKRWHQLLSIIPDKYDNARPNRLTSLVGYRGG